MIVSILTLALASALGRVEVNCIAPSNSGGFYVCTGKLFHISPNSRSPQLFPGIAAKRVLVASRGLYIYGGGEWQYYEEPIRKATPIVLNGKKVPDLELGFDGTIAFQGIQGSNRLFRLTKSTLEPIEDTKGVTVFPTLDTLSKWSPVFLGRSSDLSSDIQSYRLPMDTIVESGSKVIVSKLPIKIAQKFPFAAYKTGLDETVIFCQADGSSSVNALLVTGKKFEIKQELKVTEGNRFFSVVRAHGTPKGAKFLVNGLSEVGVVELSDGKLSLRPLKIKFDPTKELLHVDWSSKGEIWVFGSVDIRIWKNYNKAPSRTITWKEMGLGTR